MPVELQGLAEDVVRVVMKTVGAFQAPVDGLEVLRQGGVKNFLGPVVPDALQPNPDAETGR